MLGCGDRAQTPTDARYAEGMARVVQVGLEIDLADTQAVRVPTPNSDRAAAGTQDGVELFTVSVFHFADLSTGKRVYGRADGPIYLPFDEPIVIGLAEDDETSDGPFVPTRREVIRRAQWGDEGETARERWSGVVKALQRKGVFRRARTLDRLQPQYVLTERLERQLSGK
jgi:hypothetical protein